MHEHFALGTFLLSMTCVTSGFGIAVLPLLRLLDRSDALPSGVSDVLERLRGLRIWHLVVAFALSALILSQPPLGAVTMLIGLMAVFLYFRAWLHEFGFLMGLGDDAFPGRFDKIIWASVMILLGPLGLWTFRRYHLAQWPETVSERLSASAKPVMPRDWA